MAKTIIFLSIDLTRKGKIKIATSTARSSEHKVEHTQIQDP